MASRTLRDVYDIFPSQPRPQKPRRLPRRRRVATPDTSPVAPPAPAGERTVKLDWKLPARLRKPVRLQLAKERRHRQQRKAIISFQRRPLVTQPLAAHARQTGNGRNAGIEHHTGDMYRQGAPKLRVTPPPYVGSAMHLPSSAQPRRQSPAARRSQPSPRATVDEVRSAPRGVVPKRTAAPSLPLNQPLPVLPAPIRLSAHASGKPGTALSTIAVERDIPYQWTPTARSNSRPTHSTEPSLRPGTHDLFTTPEAGRLGQPTESLYYAAPQQPESSWTRFFTPLSFQIFPGLAAKWGKKKVRSELNPASPHRGEATMRQRFGSSIFLLIGCVVSAGLVWSLQGLGRGWQAMGSIEHHTRDAYGQLLNAQTALAAADTATSEQAFANAQLAIETAQTEFEDALASSRHVVRLLDVTGTVRSSEALLHTGDQLTEAGQHVSRGIGYLLGARLFEGEEETAADLTLVEAITAAQTEFTQAQQLVGQATVALAEVDSPLLPAELAGEVENLRQSLPRLEGLLSTFLEQSGLLLRVLGADRERQYLLLFANNHEIRPVGGFLGSLALVNVDQGVIENIDVQTVYDPDGQLKEFIAPPDPLLAITQRWYMRDANWFVDYPTSAKKIAAFFEKEGGPTVDGVILMTPEVIRSLLTITGPIEVPGYDTTVSADNFYVVTQDQVTYDYDRETNQPKQFLADLVPQLLGRLFGESDNGSGSLATLSALTHSLERKDMVLYFKDAELEERVVQAGWAGTYPSDAPGFLAVNNANIGGHKSDQFIEQEIDYRTELTARGEAEVVVTIRRTHRGPSEAIEYDYPAGENPAQKDNVIYQRVLVPRGAQLLDAEGFTAASDVPTVTTLDPAVRVLPDGEVVEWQRLQSRHTSGTMVGEEAGYAFFANWQITKPGQTTVGLYRYRLPHQSALPGTWSEAGTYKMYIAKQPGDTRTTIRASLLVPPSHAIAYALPREGATHPIPQEFVYRGGLTSDRMIGAVVEKAD